mmetsp:Transcript_15653/g.27295  ORF Transcript_15653/g.27295 Transcript_15653/m.27295 type:complete len:214 (+) Transcript_15653:364-1005(+)
MGASDQIVEDVSEKAVRLEKIEKFLVQEALQEKLRRRTYENEGHFAVDLHDVIYEKYSRLKDVLEDAENEEEALNELYILRKKKLELSWEVLWQTALTYRTVVTLLKEKESRSIEWNEKQIKSLDTFLETATLKCTAIKSSCLADSYSGESEQSVFRYLNELLTEKLDSLRAELERKHTSLERLKKLPGDLVDEYASICEAINEKEEYIRRLE